MVAGQRRGKSTRRDVNLEDVKTDVNLDTRRE